MKNLSDVVKAPKTNRKAGDLKAEYRFNYAQVQPNRFAGRRGKAPGCGLA
jgi:hypothetical protein